MVFVSLPCHRVIATSHRHCPRSHQSIQLTVTHWPRVYGIYKARQKTEQSKAELLSPYMVRLGRNTVFLRLAFWCFCLFRFTVFFLFCLPWVSFIIVCFLSANFHSLHLFIFSRYLLLFPSFQPSVSYPFLPSVSYPFLHSVPYLFLPSVSYTFLVSVSYPFLPSVPYPFPPSVPYPFLPSVSCPFLPSRSCLQFPLLPYLPSLNPFLPSVPYASFAVPSFSCCLPISSFSHYISLSFLSSLGFLYFIITDNFPKLNI